MCLNFRFSHGLPYLSRCHLHPCPLAQIESLEDILDPFIARTSFIQSNEKFCLSLPSNYIQNLTTLEHLLLTILVQAIVSSHLGF